MKAIFCFAAMLLNVWVLCQTPTELAQPIVQEGKLLYRCEMASWYGTDVFLEKYADKGNIGGYFSYIDRDVAKCIFFSRSEKPGVIGTIVFDSTYNVKTAGVDLTKRDFTDYENRIYQVRKTALEEINSDKMFKTYENAHLNLIPLINGTEAKVYVLTGPQQHGVVLIGNDYLLRFDSVGKLVSKKQLHQNLIPIHYGGQQDKQVVGAMHSHLPETGDFITATDICTLMLYARFAGWKTHNVVSRTYLNIWNCETNELTVVPVSAVDKNKEQVGDSKRKKKGN